MKTIYISNDGKEFYNKEECLNHETDLDLANRVLNTTLFDGAPAKSVREYLSKLLTMIIDEKEGFDGKRPFGNSDWFDNDLLSPLSIEFPEYDEAHLENLIIFSLKKVFNG